MIVAAVSLVVLMAQGQWLIALLQFAFFALGGIGVREHSVVAATLVAIAYWVNQIAATLTGAFPGFLWIAAGILLLANIRGTYIAGRWAKRGDPDAMPERFSESFKDKFVDQMPTYLWPKTKVFFFVLSGIYALLLLIGTAVLMTRHPAPVVQLQKPPSATYTLPIKP
jgi:hypothetical protein